jgi:hypothetical protein
LNQQEVAGNFQDGEFVPTSRRAQFSGVSVHILPDPHLSLYSLSPPHPLLSMFLRLSHESFISAHLTLPCFR